MNHSHPHQGRPPRPTRRAVLTALPAAGLIGSAAPALASPPGAGAEQRSPLAAAYVEVNNDDLVHAGDYVLAGTATPVFGAAIIFAANINRDGREAVLHLNERVQWTLDHAAEQIRPLQERGIKVLLSILGNHQGTGLANFPSRGAANRFAKQVGEVVDRYGLDGVDLDDEYSEYGKDGTPQPNEHSFVDLVASLRRELGRDRLITLYAIGSSAERTVFRNRRAGDLLDYAWNPWYGTWMVPDVPGMEASRLGPAAVDVRRTPTGQILELARRTSTEGCGVMIAYDVGAQDSTEAVSAMTRGLYGVGAERRV